MTEGAYRYAVLLSGPEQLQADKLAEALAAWRKVPFADAARLARGAWGFAADDLAEAEARVLAGKLKDAGLDGIVLPDNLVEELPQPVPAASAVLDKAGFEAVPKSGGPERIPWDRLALVAAAGFKRTTVDIVKSDEGPGLARKAASLGLMMVTGLPVSLGGGKREVEKTRKSTELVFYLDLYRRKPSKRLRIDAQDFNYGCLGARMAYSVLENFRILVQELVSRAPGARQSRGARILAEGSPIPAMGYDSLEELERESRWLLTLESLKDP